MSGLVDTRRSRPNEDEVLKRICEDERRCSYSTLDDVFFENHENNDNYWYDGDNVGYDCAGYAPSSRTSQRLNHSVDSCRSLKPIISLSTTPPKSAPPIALPSAADNVEPIASSSEGTDSAAANSSMVQVVEGCEVNSSTEQANDSQKSDLTRPADLNMGDAKAAVCDNEESEYRRFKSEGSTAGIFSAPAPELDMSIDDFSPIMEQRMVLPNRITLEQPKNSQQYGPISKLCHTDQVRNMHTLKLKLQKYQGFLDKAFESISLSSRNDQALEGCSIVKKVLTKSKKIPLIGHDLHHSLCEYMRERSYFHLILVLESRIQTFENTRFACAEIISECLTQGNRQSLLQRKDLKLILANVQLLTKGDNQQRVAVSIVGQLFKQTADATFDLIDIGALDFLIHMCSHNIDISTTLEQCSVALANVALYSCQLSKKQMILKKVPEWLFFLASQTHQVTCYYACLATCILTTSSQTEAEAMKSGVIAFIEPFLEGKRAHEFIDLETLTDHALGKSKEWLKRLLPLLNAKCREARAIASFHFAMEAIIKKNHENLEIFQEIGAIAALKEVASSPDEIAARFASEALTVIGEEVPYKLSQQVPCWSTSDVQYWVKKIGFEKYADAFLRNMVDGDMLLLITEEDLKKDIQISSGLLRRRFMRELESLKIAADYAGLDDTHLDQFLMSLCPEFSIYTYQMLSNSVNRPLLPLLTDEMMKNECGMRNPVHRLKLKQALQNSKHIEDIEISLLSRQIDVFISYRRSTGNQLASLIKVLLQLRGYKVFIDVDKLYAGKFDSSLLKSIQAAKHFVLVLTPNCFDRLLNDENCEDWIHKELRCAFDHEKNVIPIFDQHFEFPTSDAEIPADIRHITRYNGVRWVHDYQDACMDKVERFIKGELNRSPTLCMSEDKPQMQMSSISKISSFDSSMRSTTSRRNSGSYNDQLAKQKAATTPIKEQTIDEKVSMKSIKKEVPSPPSSKSGRSDASSSQSSVSSTSKRPRPPKLGETVGIRHTRSPPSARNRNDSSNPHASVRRHVSMDTSKKATSPRWAN